MMMIPVACILMSMSYTIGREMSQTNPGPLTSAGSPSITPMAQEDVAITTKAWEDIFPAVFLLTSLVLQLVLLVTGELRKYTSKVNLFAWLAYVGADSLASFSLGFLSRMKIRSGLFGLWSALLIYHLGGPDNFTAYERADSDLWLRHLLYLALEVVTAAYVIAVNTRGFFLIPTLLVFVVGVLRYWERNQALKKSSRGGINKAMAPIYVYMETQGFADNGCPDEYLQYIVAGTKDWYKDLRAGRSPEKEDFVTTADIYNVVTTKLKLSPSDCVRVCRLSVATASSFAYLRRVIALTRKEQESSRSNMRMLWFLNKERIERQDWLAYIRKEQDFLYDWLYAKPPYPNTYMSRLFLRILCSLALFGALVMVFVMHADELNMRGSSYEGLDKGGTYVVLAAGFVIELAYLLRLLVSNWAVVAMLVAVVRTQQARSGSLGKLRASFVLLMCRLSLSSNGFFERLSSKGDVTYLPRSNWLIRQLFSRCHWLMEKLSISETDWDQMIRAISSNESSFQALLQGIQAQEIPALDILLKLVEYLSDYNVRRKHLSGGEPAKPFYMMRRLDIFVEYYNNNWEHVLLIWWIGTLKVLILEGQPEVCLTAIQIEVLCSQGTTLTTLETRESVNSGDSKVSQTTETSEDIDGKHVQDTGTAEPKHEISSNGSLLEDKATEASEDIDGMHVQDTGTAEPKHEISFNRSLLEDKSTSKDERNLGRSMQRTGSQMPRNIVSFRDLRNRALWLMAYVCRLLTVCPELLPTHLELTKRVVADELRIAHQQIMNPTRWVSDTRRRVESLKIPALEVGEHRSEETINSIITRMKQEGFADPGSIDRCSSELAVLMVQHMSMEDRWGLIEGSGSHFIACLANASRTAEHCAKLTQGGELQTTLSILFSHLGGGNS